MGDLLFGLVFIPKGANFTKNILRPEDQRDNALADRFNMVVTNSPKE